MYVKRNFSILSILNFSGIHLIWLTCYGILSVSLFEFLDYQWLSIPWLPVSLIGTAVAFYVGFKNNSAYDRMWEARKIWGAIVNDSRSLGIATKHFINDYFASEKVSDDELHTIHRTILYRHIAWLYSLRTQLLIPTTWEHVSASKHMSRMAQGRIQRFGTGLLNEKPHEEMLGQLLSNTEINRLESASNKPTRLLDLQAEDIAALRSKDLIDDFRHIELQSLLRNFFTHQGKCERIKNYPLPRQYASISLIFVGIFIFLLPYGLMAEFQKMGEGIIWLTVPFVVLVGWVFIMMELVGDYSENPFEGLGNDIPMMSLCRTIEIDLRQMLNETDIPSKITPKNNILM